jgi:tetratricopeptide (TPR) repeat protein
MRTLCLGVCAALLIGCGSFHGETLPDVRANLGRARIFLAAGDYRRAIEACQEEITARPSARSYVYLTYVYQAVDAYLDALAQADRWIQVEQLSRSLASGRPEELLDPPDVLARIAKELIQESARKQSDATAAMAERLDKEEVTRLWVQQKSWRVRSPEGWWFGVPPEWNW